MKYKQLTLKERYHISHYLERGWRQKAIAEKIGVHPSTVNREIRRNWDGYLEKYDVGTAHIKTENRHIGKPKYTVITDKVEHYIRQKLKEQ